MRINTNISAMNTYSKLGSANNAKSKSLEKLSSGLRINKAGDDAAGLAISEKMRGQISGLNQSVSNAQDGISLIQTAEGALNETHSILQRMRELAVQSSNDTSTNADRKEIQKEFNQLVEEIDRIGDNTEFNTQNLVDGSFSGKFHIGANEGQSITLSVADMRSTQLGTQDEFESTNAVVSVADLDFTTDNASVQIGNTTIVLDEDYSNDMDGLAKKLNGAFSHTEGISVTAQGSNLIYTGATTFTDPVYAGAGEAKLGTEAAAVGAAGGALLSTLKDDTLAGSIGLQTQAGADSAITAIDFAIEKVSAERAMLGATQNRLEHTINNLTTTSENLTAAESRIRDVDMAKEMMDFTKNNILSQAATSMLAQANQMPQSVLQLLQ